MSTPSTESSTIVRPGDQVFLQGTEVAVVAAPTTKPGYKTTEFWLGLAAMVLTALYASGVIPTGGAAATVAAMAATILGALGYTVVRGATKKAEALK